MRERIKALYEARDRAVAAGRAIVDSAEAEKRSLTAEEFGSIEKTNADIDTLDGTIAQLEGLLTRAEASTASRERLGLAPGREESRQDRTPDMNTQLRSLPLGGALELPAMSPAEARATLVGAGAGNASAGVLTQKEFVAQFLSTLVDNSSLLSLNPRVITTQHGNLVEWPRQTGRVGNASRIAENVQIPKLTDPTFDRVQLGVTRYAGIVQISHDMMEDGIVDLSGLLAVELGEAVANATNADFYLGTGTSQPWGLLTRAAVGVTGGAGAAPTFDNLIDLEHSILPKYRANAVFILNDATLKALRKVKDTTGAYLWQPSTRDGAPATINGRQYTIDTNIPNFATAAKSVLFGDVSKYWVRQVQGVRVERSTEYAFDTDLVSWKAVWRAGGDLMDLSAVKAYTSA